MWRKAALERPLLIGASGATVEVATSANATRRGMRASLHPGALAGARRIIRLPQLGKMPALHKRFEPNELFSGL
jgi:hypothetical protein